MRKIFIAALAAITLLSAPVCASEPLMGGWQVTDDTAITPEAQNAFDKALEGFAGASYDPVALLSTQVVAGTNYCFLCRVTPVTADPVSSYAFVYIYEDLQGSAEILEVKDIEMGISPLQESDDTSEDNPYDETIRQALELIKDAWKAQSEEYPGLMPEPFVDIKNTRVIKIAEEPVNVQADNAPVENLEDVDYIIEFMMITNYFGNTLPANAGILDTVVVYRSGKMEVQKFNLMDVARARYYITDYSGVIEKIIDFGDTYSGQLVY